MDYVMLAFTDYIQYVVAGLCGACLLLLCVCAVLAVHIHSHRRRMDRFFGSRSERRNLEAVLSELKAGMAETDHRCAEVAAQANARYDGVLTDAREKYDDLLALIDNINERLHFCLQGVGVVRYNPFEHMGGDQSFAVALLDEQANGIVLSTIHGRDASYTYAKPVVGGESSYTLSPEERRAIAKAANQNKLVASYPD